jgi:hypothetical protein
MHKNGRFFRGADATALMFLLCGREAPDGSAARTPRLRSGASPTAEEKHESRRKRDSGAQ